MKPDEALHRNTTAGGNQYKTISYNMHDYNLLGLSCNIYCYADELSVHLLIIPLRSIDQIFL